MKKYSKRGLKIGIAFGLIMTAILAISYTSFFSSIGIGGSIIAIILIIYLIPFSFMMFQLDNSTCSLKHATDCTQEIIVAMVVSTIFFALVGFLIGFILDKFNK